MDTNSIQTKDKSLTKSNDEILREMEEEIILAQKETMEAIIEADKKTFLGMRFKLG